MMKFYLNLVSMSGNPHLNIPDIEDAYMLGIVRALVETKEQIKRKDDAM